MLSAPRLKLRYKWNIDHNLHSRASNTLAEAKALNRPHLTTNCQREFLHECWGLQLKDLGLEKELQSYQSYLHHYEESCLYVPILLADCTHEHFCKAAQQLQKGTRESCEAAIEPLLPPTSQNHEAAKECINFIGKAILLIDVLGWGADETLSDFIIRVIALDSKQEDHYRMPLYFNARTFAKVAGIKILWTRDLLSHLEMGSNDSTLSVFHNAKVLQLYEQSSLKSIFPDEFVDETRRTLSLMLPVADKASVKWFGSEQRRLGLDITAGDCRHLRTTQRNIQDFNFWRDRLIITKEAFDTSQPSGLLQFWRDDRNRVQWWTFWIAVTVFLLTLVGVVESALQVYKAYHPSPQQSMSPIWTTANSTPSVGYH